ncbi:MAG TPA: hypothetical protein VKW06_06685 [Candidatus Angelobacter sp.]|nr:hypothetical protein [Candidatus Angelobacter sp.]
MARFFVDWKPVSRPAFFGWMAFYLVLLIYLAAHFSSLTFLDNVHLPVHEAGHLLFGWFGATIGVWGGTILQLLVPALLVVAFVARGDLLGTTFCSFAFFHSLTGVAAYMIDALRRELTLVTVGASADEAEHDWVHIFSDLGVLPHAIQIGNVIRVIAWLGFLGTLAWFAWRYYQQSGPLSRSQRNSG